MAATPKEFEKAFSQYKLEVAAFDGVVARIDQDVKEATVKSSAGAGAGIAAGTATALLGPSAAMAVATTFGTASTGTAISTLTGAAATKAALAWLGGGALAAGGGGMSAGTALLGLAGPVGWALAGTAVVGGAAYMRYANHRATNDAEKQCLAFEAEIRSMDATAKAVEQLSELTMTHVTGLYRLLTRLRDQDELRDFNDATDEQQNMLMAIINHVATLGKLLNKTVDLKAAR